MFRKILINTDKIKPEEIEKKESSIRPEEIVLRGEMALSGPGGGNASHIASADYMTVMT